MNIFINWLKTLLRSMSLILVIPLLIIALLLTPFGLKIGFAIVSKTVPGQLHYRQVHGTLWHSFTVDHFSYRYKDDKFTAQQIFLQWKPLALLSGKIFVEKINITNLSVNIPPPEVNLPKHDNPIKVFNEDLEIIRQILTNWHLPFKLQVVQGSINRVNFTRDPKQIPIQASNILINGILQSDLVKIKFDGNLIQPYDLQIHLLVNGIPKNYQFQLTAFNPETHWAINGAVTPDQFQLDTSDALIFGGKLDLHLNYYWSQLLSWNLKLNAQHLDLSKLHPDWPHPLDAKIESTGNLSKNYPHFSWNAIINTPQTQLETQGQYNKQWDISWKIAINQLAELLPFSSGSLNSSGELHGSLNRPITKGALQGSLLHWQEYRIDKISANWNIDVSQKAPSQIQIEASQLFSQLFQIQNIKMTGVGRWDKHQLNAKIHGYDTDLEIGLNGGLGTQDWHGSLNHFMIFAPHAGKWELTKPTALTISPQRIDVTAMCLQSDYQSQLCFRGQWQGTDNTWQAYVTSRLNLHQLGTLMPEDLTINVPMDLYANLQGTGKIIQQAQLSAKSGKGYIRYANETQKIQSEITSTAINGKIDKNGGSFNLQINLENQNSITASLTLPQVDPENIFAKNQELQGKIKIQLNNLSLLQTFIPDVVATSGKFQANFSINGSVEQPLISGNAEVEQGQLKIPGLNIQLSAISLALNAKGKELFYSLNATSANRPLKLVGQTDLGQNGFPTELTLTGDNVLLADTPLYTLYVTPNVHASIKGQDINLSGTVDIPKAVLHQMEFQQDTILPIDEVVFIGEHPIIKKTPWNVTTELTINLGKHVTVDSPGLKAKLAGSLTLISQPGQVMLGVGRIDIIDGVYEVYGRKLTIAPNSAIIYRRNPINNPTLSIQATTRVVITDAFSQQQLGTNELTVGMNIGGTSSSPQVTLFSSAGNLSQADMLSYLLLGTSSAGISPTNMNLLLQALNTLPLTKRGASGVEGLTSQIKQSLGFSEFGVESETTFGPTGEPIPTQTPTSYFVVGKRLTTRMYLRYKYDPFNSVNLFQLNYYFSKNWSLQIETDGNTQSGADILYTIETGTPKSATKTPESTTK